MSEGEQFAADANFVMHVKYCSYILLGWLVSGTVKMFILIYSCNTVY